MTTPTLVSAKPERLHVLQLVGGGITGGAGHSVLRLVERLPRERFRTSAVLPHECRLADQLRHRGADVSVMPMPDDPPWASIQGVAALVQHAGVDVLHAHMPNAHALAALAGHLTGRAVMATIHARQLAPTDVEAQRSATTHLAVVCRHTYHHALAMGLDARVLSCIPNGVDARVFAPGGERVGALRRQLGLDAETLVVGFVGRLAPEKGPDQFLHAAEQVHRLAPAAHLVMVGDGPLRAELAQFVERSGLASHVHLVGQRDDVPALLHELDVVASTSHTEAMPLALLEAMASGLPVVAMAVGGVPELVDHGCTGWLAGARDCEGVAQHIAHLLHDAGERRRMGENAREHVLERFTLDDCVQRTGDLLLRLAARVAAFPVKGTAPGSATRPAGASRPTGTGSTLT